MAETQLPADQIKDEDLRTADFKDFAPEDGGSLNLNVAVGRVRSDNTITDKTAQVVALTDNITNFVEINTLGVASANTSSFTSGSIPIALVVTASGSISSITDKRSWVNVGGGSGGVTGSGTANTLARFSSSSVIADANVTQDGSTGVIVTTKALAPTAVTLSDAATIATDASLGNDFRVTITLDRTLGVPTNPTEGQMAIWRITASGADRILTLDTGVGGFKFGSDITVITVTVNGETDYIGAKYISASNHWVVLAYIKGY